MKKLLPALGVVALPLSSFAVDYSTLTDSVDFAEVITAVVSVGAAMVLFYVAYKGVKFIIGAVRGG